MILKLGLAALTWVNWLKHQEHPFAILYFHRILDEHDPYCPDDWTKESFDMLIGRLNRHFNIVSISEALALQSEGRLPKGSLALSFDDGYQDNFTNAKLILEKYGIKGCFFVATQGLERGYLWNDELQAVIESSSRDRLHAFDTSFPLGDNTEKAQTYLNLVGQLKVLPNEERDKHLQEIVEQLGQVSVPRVMMTADQLLLLQRTGHDVGAHTHTHSILSYQSDAIAEKEIRISIAKLNDVLPNKVTLFAYPNGWYGKDFTQKHEIMLRQCGVEIGLSTNDGGVTSRTRRTAIPRFMPYRKEINQFCLSIQKIAGE